MKPSSSKFKKALVLLSIMLIVMSALAVPTSAATISVFVNGVQMISDASPINAEGKILAPASSVFQMFGADVGWDAKTGTMIAVAPGMRITIISGEQTASVNNKTIKLDTPARTINGRLYIPVSLAADAFGAKINWNADLQRITITGGLNMIQSSNTQDYAKAKIQAAVDSLSTSVSIELDSMDVTIDELFKIEEFGEIKNWTYEGVKTNDKIAITWKLELFDGHAVISAYRNPALESKLTVKQKELLHKCRGILEEIIKPGMTDYQKQLAIHDYIVLNCEYDITAQMSQTATGQEDLFFAYGALIDGVAVCGGYSEAASLLLTMSGIESYILHSKDHSWNLVKLDDGYYHMDISWDDPTPDIKGRVRHDYFNLTDAQISQYSSHDWLNEEELPAANVVKHNYFVYNNLVAHNHNELKQILTKAIQSGEREITVMIADHRTGGYVWDRDLAFITGLLTDAKMTAKFSYSPPNSERDTLTVMIGL